MTRYLVVAFGGALGAIARYWFSSLIGERVPTRFPLGTLIINVTGSFIIGFFLTFVTERINIHPNWRLGVAVGFVGAYTTFSTFEYETFRLLETGSGIGGFMNVIVSLMLGFLAVWGGIALGREISAPAIVREKIFSRGIKWAANAPISTGAQDGPFEQEFLELEGRAAQDIRHPGGHD